ncbi:MAG: magnesium transporter accessory protein [Frankia sp.]
MTPVRAVGNDLSGYPVTMNDLGIIGALAAVTLAVIGVLLAFTTVITWDLQTILGVFAILLAAMGLFGSGIGALSRRF